MLNQKTPLMAEPNWIPTAMHLPSDGQSVLVKGRYDDEPRAVVFRRYPAARWENRGSVYRFEYFNQWAVMSLGQAQAAS